jgi:hypothetical protein
MVKAKPTQAEAIVAVVIECVDTTCTVVGRGPAATWPSVQEAMSAIDQLGPHITWSETTPGFWVARAACVPTEGLRDASNSMAQERLRAGRAPTL